MQAFAIRRDGVPITKKGTRAAHRIYSRRQDAKAAIRLLADAEYRKAISDCHYRRRLELNFSYSDREMWKAADDYCATISPSKEAVHALYEIETLA